MCGGSAPTPTAGPAPIRRATQPSTQPAIAAQSRRAGAAGDDQRRRLRSGSRQTILTRAGGLGTSANTKKTLLGG